MVRFDGIFTRESFFMYTTGEVIVLPENEKEPLSFNYSDAHVVSIRPVGAFRVHQKVIKFCKLIYRE
ncbi:hypothetical protein MAH1_35380 [Sessilibacter sp. MAH1]